MLPLQNRSHRLVILGISAVASPYVAAKPDIPMRRFSLTAVAFLSAVCVLPVFANAKPSLMGRTVEFSVQTYDDPENPYFAGQVHSTVVSEGIEFGLGREGIQNELDVVPVLVNIGKSSVEISYSISDPGELASAKFNGYIINFITECELLGRARIDPTVTNVEIDNKRISNDGTTLSVDVSGLRYNRESRISVSLEVQDCSQ
jgi:hypothetical protein